MRVLVVEDDALLREGLRLILQQAGHRVETLPQAPADPATLTAHAPDLLLTDIRLPPNHRDEGLRLANTAREQRPDLNVLVLSAHLESVGVLELFETTTAGTGYLLKDRIGDVPTFVSAVERVATGGSAVDPEVITQAMRRSRPTPLDALTERERHVLATIAEGLGNSEIAERLVISESAVNKHVGNIFDKLDLNHRAGHRRVLAVLTYLAQAGM